MLTGAGLSRAWRHDRRSGAGRRPQPVRPLLDDPQHVGDGGFPCPGQAVVEQVDGAAEDDFFGVADPPLADVVRDIVRYRIEESRFLRGPADERGVRAAWSEVMRGGTGHHWVLGLKVEAMLIAEDLLLLLTDDETGKLAASASEVDVALGGALLVELTLMQRVDLAGPSEQIRKGRLVVRDATATSDPLLDEALATVGQKQGKKPQNVVTALGKQARVRLYDRLVGRGLLRAESGKILGIFPGHNWPAQDATHEDAVRTDLLTALRNAMTADPRTGALISLLLALKAVPKAVGPAAAGLSKREMNASAKRIAEGDWASGAVRHAIDGMNAAVIAAISSTVVLGGGS